MAKIKIGLSLEKKSYLKLKMYALKKNKKIYQILEELISRI